jgi:adenylosuccinate synthase
MSNDDEIQLINNEKETNIFNDWQKGFRIGELDYDLLNHAISIDIIYSEGYTRNLVVTCLDQRPGFVFDEDKIHVKFKTISFSKSPDSDKLQVYYHSLKESN